MVRRFTICASDEKVWAEDHPNGTLVYYEDYAALEAQLAARTGGVKVKPLEWTTSFIGSVNTGTVKAITEVGDYYAEWNGAFFEIELNTWATLPGFEVREWIGKDGADGAESRAKAAAQADYEQRILSALSPAPEAQQERPAEQAVTEAARAVLAEAEKMTMTMRRRAIFNALKAAMEAGR